MQEKAIKIQAEKISDENELENLNLLSDYLLSINFNLKENYVHNKKLEYFVDNPLEKNLTWQPEVYKILFELAKKFNIKYIIDVGCGHANKLEEFSNDFEIIGIDFGENINYCRENYEFGTWIEFDFERKELIKITPKILSQSLIVCADVIEYMINPTYLLYNIKHMLKECRIALISTPERDSLRGVSHFGPPVDNFHIREWNFDELNGLMECFGFNVVKSLRSINNDKEFKRQTTLCLISETSTLFKWEELQIINETINTVKGFYDSRRKEIEDTQKKYVIISGYYAGEKKTTQFSISKEEFFETWYENTIRYCNPEKVYIVNVSKAKPSRQFPDIEWINMSDNLGHVNDLLNNNDTISLSGYTLSVLIGMLIAYNNKSDFIYKEQDCLAFGDWINELYNQLGQTDKKMLIGRGHMEGFIEQSLFICKYDYILEFVLQYLNFKTGDYPHFPEKKFVEIMTNQQDKIGFFDFGYGRIRPVNFDDKIFFIQQPTDEELTELKKRKLIDGEKVKVNFGCGDNRLPGWINHDFDVDITKPLPYADNSVDLVFAEHVVEHVSIRDAYNFLNECYRILKKGGAVRITVPSISRIYNNKDQEYVEFLRKHNWGDGSEGSAVKAIIFNHGHEAVWTEEILEIYLKNIGFETKRAELYKSDIAEFNNIEGHQKVIGEKFNSIESISAEGYKV